MLLLLPVDATVDRLHCLPAQLPHLLMHTVNVHIFPGELSLQVSLKLTVAEFVAFLVLAVVVSVLLDGIVGEVDVGVEEVGQVVWLR